MLSASEASLVTSKPRFFASLRMTKEGCHAERSEASLVVGTPRFFASLRMTKEGCPAERGEASQILRFPFPLRCAQGQDLGSE
jgi:hypothetical protein